MQGKAKPIVEDAGEPQPSAADGRRRELARHAAEQFDAVGYHQTTVADIGEAMGLSKASVYHYFSSKDEILFWIHEDFVDELITRHEARLRTPMPAAQSLLELIGDMLDVVENSRSEVRVFFEHFRELTPEQQAPIRVKRARYQTFVEDVIRRGIETGELRDLDPRLTTLALFGMCNWAYQWFSPDGPLRSRQLAYFFWDLFLRGASRNAGS